MTRLQVGQPRIRGFLPAKGKKLCVLRSAETGSGAH